MGGVTVCLPTCPESKIILTSVLRTSGAKSEKNDDEEEKNDDKTDHCPSSFLRSLFHHLNPFFSSVARRRSSTLYSRERNKQQLTTIITFLLQFFYILSQKRTMTFFVHAKKKATLLLVTVVVGWSINLSSAISAEEEKQCPCKLEKRPDIFDKAKTARWMAHSLNWGVLSTISSRLEGENGTPIPFGNIYSFVDGPCHHSTGIPYVYSTFLDQSMQDSMENSMVSFSLSEATLPSACGYQDGLSACTVGTKYGDPESPVCARLVLTGKLIVLEEGEDEYTMARDALFQRHTAMESWPSDHNWIIAKVDIQDIWLIDYFGGATILPLEEYFGVEMDDAKQEEEEDELS